MGLTLLKFIETWTRLKTVTLKIWEGLTEVNFNARALSDQGQGHCSVSHLIQYKTSGPTQLCYILGG